MVLAIVVVYDSNYCVIVVTLVQGTSDLLDMFGMPSSLGLHHKHLCYNYYAALLSRELKHLKPEMYDLQTPP